METTTATPQTTNMAYAGFGARLVAYIIDGIVIGCIYTVITLILGVVGVGLGAAAASNVETMSEQELAAMGGLFAGAFLVMMLVVTAVTWLYFSIMESSASQGTLGKMAMGIKVTDLDGQRISFGKAFLRQIGKYISGAIMMIGYLMAAFTEKKQALHDMIASTLVVKK